MDRREVLAAGVGLATTMLAPMANAADSRRRLPIPPILTSPDELVISRF